MILYDAHGDDWTDTPEGDLSKETLDLRMERFMLLKKDENVSTDVYDWCGAIG